MTQLEPMLLSPYFRAYPWGGDRLAHDFGKETSVRPLAESWEFSCHEGGLSVIDSGAYAGMTLRDYLAERPGLVGADVHAGDEFPIMIKLIDAQRTLALQVHPDDEYARRVENSQGKTEMWYVLDAAPGAGVYYGFKQPEREAAVRKAIQEGTLQEKLSFFEAHAGDVFFIPAGVVHAIGAGLLIAEVQQNSDIIYRLYDFGYLGPDGKPREMHVDKGLDVAQLAPAPRNRGAGEVCFLPGGSRRVLANCKKFFVCELQIEGDLTLCADESSFHALLCLEGNCEIVLESGRLALAKGRCAFVPAGLRHYMLRGHARVLQTTRGIEQG